MQRPKREPAISTVGRLDKDTSGVGRMRFFVILSLTRINDAREALRSSILLPVLVSVLMGIAIAGLELFVQCIQAYIFVVLTAQYIGSAIAEDH